MKKFGLVVALVCAVALSSLMVACGGGDGGDPSKNFEGNWVIASMEEDGEVMGEEELAAMEELGMTATLSLNADKSAKLEMFGEELTGGTWEAKDASTFDLTFEGETLEGKLVNGEIVLEQDGLKVVFKKA